MGIKLEYDVDSVLEEAKGYALCAHPFDERVAVYDSALAGIELPPGALTEQDHWVLLKYAKDKNIAVDCGTFCGRSATLLSTGAKRVFTIDVYQHCDWADMSLYNYEANQERLAKFKNITLLKGNTSEMTDLFMDKSIDLLFVDTEHVLGQIYKEVRQWYDKLTDDAVIIFHDYSVFWDGVVQVVNELVSKGVLNMIEVRGWCCVCTKGEWEDKDNE